MSSRLTAMDILNQEFRRKLRGWDDEEVRLFLRSAADEVERLNLENGQLREETGRMRSELEELRSREKTLQQTLVTAQRLTDEMKDRARGEGELVVKESRLKADRILQHAREQMIRLEVDIERARTERETLEHSLRSILDQHQTMLNMRRDARGEFDNLRVMPQSVRSDAG